MSASLFPGAARDPKGQLTRERVAKFLTTSLRFASLATFQSYTGNQYSQRQHAGCLRIVEYSG